MEEAELTPALERVAASVVETHRKRQQVEEDLKAAAAAVASLHAQSSSLEASVSDLRSQLEVAIKAKSQEDGAVAQLAARRQSALDQMAAIEQDIATFLADKERSAAEIATQIEASRAKLVSVRQELSSVKDGLAFVERDSNAVRDRLGVVRKSADATEAQLNETNSKARELDVAVDAMAARICAVTEELDHAEKSKQQVATSGDELRAVSAALDVRRREAEAAGEQMRGLLEERAQQTAALTQQLERIAQLSGEADRGKAASAASSPVNAVPQSASAPGAVPVQAAANDHASAAAKTPEATTNGAPAQAPVTNGAPTAQRFENTMSLLELLASVGFIATPEAQSAAELLHVGDVDKLVRSMWSRAMGGPAPGFYRLVIGSALSESGDPKGAMTFFNKALEGRQVDPFATYLVAVSLLQMKRYVDVLNIAQALGRSKTGKALGRNVEALHLQGTGRLDDAEKKFGEALGLAGYPRLHYNETMYNLGLLAESRGDARSAYMWYEKLASGDPSYRDVGIHMEKVKAGAQTA